MIVSQQISRKFYKYNGVCLNKIIAYFKLFLKLVFNDLKGKLLFKRALFKVSIVFLAWSYFVSFSFYILQLFAL